LKSSWFVPSKTAKDTCHLEAFVGCNGDYWKAKNPLLTNLQDQTTNDTLSEVFGLPLVGWRLTIDTTPPLRSKRQAGDDLGW